MSYTSMHAEIAKEIKEEPAEYIERVQSPDEDLAREEKALVRKIDLFLLPTIWLMYLLSYMDRTKSVIIPLMQVSE